MHKISAPTRTLETHRDNHAGRHPHEHAHEHAHHVGRRAPRSGTGRPLPDSDAEQRCGRGHLSTGSVSRTADTGRRSSTTGLSGGRRAAGSGTGRPLPDSDAERRYAPGHLSTGSVGRTADTGGRSSTSPLGGCTTSASSDGTSASEQARLVQRGEYDRHLGGYPWGLLLLYLLRMCLLRLLRMCWP